MAKAAAPIAQCGFPLTKTALLREDSMPTFQPTPDLTMHYQVDDFTAPWRKPETVLLLHGNAERDRKSVV